MFNKITIKNSSFVKGFSYEDGVLNIKLGKNEYTYIVNEELFIGLVLAESKGQYYNKFIKNRGVK